MIKLMKFFMAALVLVIFFLGLNLGITTFLPEFYDMLDSLTTVIPSTQESQTIPFIGKKSYIVKIPEFPEIIDFSKGSKLPLIILRPHNTIVF